MDRIIYRDLVLHNTAKHVIEQDILVFLKREMNQIQEEHEVSGDWPGQHNIRIIAQWVEGFSIQSLLKSYNDINKVFLLFYAATVCRFIGDLTDPKGLEKRLNLVLHGNSNGRSSTKTLARVYTQVLQTSI